MSKVLENIQNLTEIALLDEAQTAQLQEMIELAYIGNKPDKEFILQNAGAYSGLNSKAILAVVSGILSKEIAQKAVGIVALLRQEGYADKSDLLSVLGSVKRTQPKSKEDVAWEKAVSEIPPLDISGYDISNEEGLNQAIQEVLAHNDKIAERAKEIQQEAEAKKLAEEAKKAVEAEKNAAREAIIADGVESAISQIKARLATTYSDMFVNPPMGVLTPDGIYGVAGIETGNFSVRELHQQSAVLAIGVFNLIKNVCGDAISMPDKGDYDKLPVDANGKVLPGLFKQDGSCKYTYMPKLQAHLSRGLYRSEGSFKRENVYSKYEGKLASILADDIGRIFSAVLEPYANLKEHIDVVTRLTNSVVDLYTTTFIAEEIISRKVVRIRFSCPQASTKALQTVGTLIEANARNLGLDKDGGSLLNNSNSNGVVKVTYVSNKTEFTGETLFAYEALQRVYEAGGTVDMSKIVLGRKLNGDLMTIDFKAMGSTILSIQGGGRSGKGVLTLNILATIIGSGYPFIYLDNKPDMAMLLWDIERKYGKKILSIDITGKPYKELKVAGGGVKQIYPVRKGQAYNIPDTIDVNLNWHAFAYAKAIALFGLAMELKGSGRCPTLDRLDRMYAVLDEANGSSKELTANRNKLQTLKGKLKDTDPQKKIIEGMLDFLENTRLSIGTISTKYPNTGMKLVVLSQGADGEKWGGGGDQKGGVLRPLLSGAKMRILGTENAGNSDDYAMGQATAQGVELVSMDTPGHFVYSPDNVARKGKELEVFKSYLVLNYNDWDANEKHGEIIGQLVTSIKSDGALAMAMAKVAPDGEPNPLIGFEGLLKYIGEKQGIDVTANMHVGYEVMTEVAELVGIVGRYETVEDWLYDSDPATFWSNTELKNLIDKGLKVPAIGEGVGEVKFDDPVPPVTPSAPAVEATKTPAPEQKPTQPEFKPTAGPTGFKGVEEKASPDTDMFGYNEAPTQQTEPPQQTAPAGDDMFGYNEPKEQQTAQPQPQEQPQQQLYYINGMAFVLGPDGNFHFHSGRLAPLHGVEPGTFQGVPRTAAPALDQNTGRLPYDETADGELVLNDPNSMMYGEIVDGPDGKVKKKFKFIDAEKMPQAKFEKAMSERWASLLAFASKAVGGANLVASLGIKENSIFVNGKQFYPPAGVLNDAGLRVVDIVDYAMLFKHFKQLKQLMLDYKAYTVFTAQYGGIYVPFTKHKNLQVIKYVDSTGKQFTYTREHASYEYDVPVDKLHSNFNTWSAMAAQVNKGSTSSFCKPGTRLLMADYTKRLASGVFGTKSSWSTKRKVLGFVGMALTGAATVVTGGIQVARASVRKK